MDPISEPQDATDDIRGEKSGVPGWRGEQLRFVEGLTLEELRTSPYLLGYQSTVKESPHVMIALYHRSLCSKQYSSGI